MNGADLMWQDRRVHTFLRLRRDEKEGVVSHAGEIEIRYLTAEDHLRGVDDLKDVDVLRYLAMHAPF